MEDDNIHISVTRELEKYYCRNCSFHFYNIGPITAFFKKTEILKANEYVYIVILYRNFKRHIGVIY